MFSSALEAQITAEMIAPQYQQILNILKKLLEKIIANQFVVANIFVAKQENPDLLSKLMEKMSNNKTHLNSKKCFGMVNAVDIEKLINRLITVKLDGDVLEQSESLLDEHVESITFCLQPYVAINVLLHPSCSTQNYISHLEMIQQLKFYPVSRVYSELIRSALISLHNVSSETDINRESMWYAFAFIRVPQIIKQMSLKTGNYQLIGNHA